MESGNPGTWHIYRWYARPQTAPEPPESHRDIPLDREQPPAILAG